MKEYITILDLEVDNVIKDVLSHLYNKTYNLVGYITITEYVNNYNVTIVPIDKKCYPIDLNISKESGTPYLGISLYYSGKEFELIETNEFSEPSLEDIENAKNEIDELLRMKVEFREYCFVHNGEVQKIIVDIYEDINNEDEGFRRRCKIRCKFPWQKIALSKTVIYQPWIPFLETPTGL